MKAFEGSFMGDAQRIDDQTVMECGVCWWVYDPTLGDEVWQITPGTAFSELPAHWRCPNCDATREQFMVLEAADRPDRARGERPAHCAGLETIERREREMDRAYRLADERMRALPVYNKQLNIQVVGMRRCNEGLISVVVTPWCMNLVLLPTTGERRREGTCRDIAFPSGRYAFTAGYLEGLGAVETCSLFSPMEAFEDAGVAREVAEHAINALFRPDTADPPGDMAADATMSRRAFMRPGRRGLTGGATE